MPPGSDVYEVANASHIPALMQDFANQANAAFNARYKSNLQTMGQLISQLQGNIMAGNVGPNGVIFLSIFYFFFKNYIIFL